jgi:xylulokinase
MDPIGRESVGGEAMMVPGSLLGIDIGSGACKMTLIGFSGQVRSSGAREYPTYYPQPGWAEQDPEDWYTAVSNVLADWRANDVDTSDIAAICVSAPTHTAVLLDKDFTPLRRAILWTDQRSIEQSEKLVSKYDDMILRLSYNRVDPVWTLPQLMWVKENEPQMWENIANIMFAKDYVRWRLTGTYATDWIDAMGSMLFDATNLTWSDELCDLLTLNPHDLPQVMSPIDVAGRVTKTAAHETGLTEGTPVIVGTTDTALEVFGAGAIEPGQSTVKLATAGRICIISDRAYPHPHLFNYRHVVPGYWYPGTGTKSCASSYRWFRDVFCEQEQNVARYLSSSAYQLIDAEAARVPIGCEGLLFHPYLLGELSPYGDPYLKASFTGITMRHSRAYFARAILEGVAFSLLDCMSIFEELSMSISDIRMIGGGARSLLWSQIVCDVLGMPASKPEIDDSSFGGAMLAGIGIGVFKDAKEAVSTCVRLARRITPSMENHQKYQRHFRIYKELHDNLTSTYRELSRILAGEEK